MGELKKIVEFVEDNVILKKMALRRMSLIVGEDVTKVADDDVADPRRTERFRQAAEEITQIRMRDRSPRATMALTFPLLRDDRTGESILFGQAMVFHCHHYNVFLQRTIEDPSYIDGKTLLINASEEVVFTQMRDYLAQAKKPVEARKALEVASQIFRDCGLGVIQFDRADRDGGVVVAPTSHYAVGWRAKFGLRSTPACLFVCGFIAGAMEAAYSLDIGSYAVTEVRCVAVGDDEDRFQVKRVSYGR